MIFLADYGLFVLGFVLSAVLCRVLAACAPRLGLLDRPDARKQHAKPIPVVGGVAIAVSFGVVMGGALPWSAAAPLLAMLALGLLDDVYNIAAREKLLVQIAVVGALLWGSGASLYAIPLPFFDAHWVLGIFSLPLTVILVLAVINALNMIDGLDGLAGGCMLIAALNLAYAAAVVGQSAISLLAGVLAAALMGFLLWNARLPWQTRARLFLGDAGTLGIGLLLMWLATQLSLVPVALAHTRVPVTVSLAAFAVPLMDMAVVAFWRMMEGRNPMQADRGHSHHLLLEQGYSTQRAVYFLWLVAAVISVATCVAWRLGVTEGRLLGVLLIGTLMHLVLFRRAWLKLRAQQWADFSRVRKSAPKKG